MRALHAIAAARASLLGKFRDGVGLHRWFAERVDLIVLLFDPFKLDISDELTGVIRRFRGHEDKVRVVLNKSADSAYVEASST